MLLVTCLPGSNLGEHGLQLGVHRLADDALVDPDARCVGRSRAPRIDLCRLGAQELKPLGRQRVPRAVVIRPAALVGLGDRLGQNPVQHRLVGAVTSLKARS